MCIRHLVEPDKAKFRHLQNELVFGKNNHLISNRIHFEPTLAI